MDDGLLGERAESAYLLSLTPRRPVISLYLPDNHISWCFLLACEPTAASTCSSERRESSPDRSRPLSGDRAMSHPTLCALTLLLQPYLFSHGRPLGCTRSRPSRSLDARTRDVFALLPKSHPHRISSIFVTPRSSYLAYDVSKGSPLCFPIKSLHVSSQVATAGYAQE